MQGRVRKEERSPLTYNIEEDVSFDLSLNKMSRISAAWEAFLGRGNYTSRAGKVGKHHIPMRSSVWLHHRMCEMQAMAMKPGKMNLVVARLMMWDLECFVFTSVVSEHGKCTLIWSLGGCMASSLQPPYSPTTESPSPRSFMVANTMWQQANGWSFLGSSGLRRYLGGHTSHNTYVIIGYQMPYF